MIHMGTINHISGALCLSFLGWSYSSLSLGNSLAFVDTLHCLGILRPPSVNPLDADPHIILLQTT